MVLRRGDKTLFLCGFFVLDCLKNVVIFTRLMGAKKRGQRLLNHPPFLRKFGQNRYYCPPPPPRIDRKTSLIFKRCSERRTKTCVEKRKRFVVEHVEVHQRNSDLRTRKDRRRMGTVQSRKEQSLLHWDSERRPRIGYGNDRGIRDRGKVLNLKFVNGWTPPPIHTGANLWGGDIAIVPPSLDSLKSLIFKLRFYNLWIFVLNFEQTKF